MSVVFMILFISTYLSDIVFGDPERLWHPVRGIGKLIDFLDRILKGKKAAHHERIKGIFLALYVVAICIFITQLILDLTAGLNIYLGFLAWVYLGYTTLSIKDLRIKGKAIIKALENGSVVKARKELSMIVGRDTENLSKEKIITAAVESIAEGTNDGIIAPMFYLVIGGPVLAIAYKTLNTLDSMIGYKNERYFHLGWFSARADDVVNFIPARVCGFLICISSMTRGKGFKRAFKTMLRDGQNHPSPNSGISEAAMAGALEIRLGGASYYEGIKNIKPFIGNTGEKIKSSCISEALRISFITSFLMLLMGLGIKWVI
jgi:adenosylcobinamide-phosphate synthase